MVEISQLNVDWSDGAVQDLIESATAVLIEAATVVLFMVVHIVTI